MMINKVSPSVDKNHVWKTVELEPTPSQDIFDFLYHI